MMVAVDHSNTQRTGSAEPVVPSLRAEDRVIDLTSGAHVMLLDAGVFCVYHSPGQQPPGPTGLPGVRINRAPGVASDVLEISTFEADGWLGATNGAALVRVHQGPAGVLITTYQDPQHPHPPPQLQVMRLIGGVFAEQEKKAQAEAGTAALPVTKEVSAHIQRHGDVKASLGSWMGDIGSGLWIEGFSITPEGPLGVESLEYQAVLGKKWLSPWAEGGEFCGSRSMSLPILGLRVRLKGEQAEGWRLRLTATFTDGTRLGPVEGVEEGLEATTLAPLEAFLLELLPPQENLSETEASQEKTEERRGTSQGGAPRRKGTRRSSSAS